MSIKKHIPHSDPETTPSVVLLQRYLNGEASEAEKVQIEEQLAEDPLLADAIDGLKMVKDKNEIVLSVGRIQAATRKKIADKTRKRESLSRRKSRVSLPQNYTTIIIAAAAAIALLFTTVLVVRDISFTDKAAPELAQQNPAETSTVREVPEEAPEEALALEKSPAGNETATPPAVVESAPVAEPEHGGESSPLHRPIKTVAAQPVVVPQNTQLAAKPAATTTDDLPKSEDQSVAIPGMAASSEGTRDEQVTRVIIRQDSLGEYVETETLEMIPERKATPRIQAANTPPPAMDNTAGKLMKGLAMSDLLEEARKLHNSRKYAPAIGKLDEVLQSEPENQVAQFYKASSLHGLGKYNECISLIKPIAAKTESPLYEDARWLLARSYSLSGRKNAAIKLLEKIEADGGIYAGDARKLRETYQ
ncbi:MAG: CDC27 family protein [Bacteroidia bacterium]